jgi:hypothetical protein
LKVLTWILVVTVEWASHVGFVITNQWRLPVTYLKTLSAIAILTAAIATPVFAKPTHHSRAGHSENSQFNRSFPGGEDPDNNPPGN